MIEKRKKSNRTVSQDLIIVLTSTLIIIVSTVGALYYTYAASIAERDLETYAHQMTREFSQDIALPLFNFELETVRHIAKASLQSESLVGITITVDANVVFEKLPQAVPGMFSREKKVVWHDETVGVAKLTFTGTKIVKENKSRIKLVALILFCVILSISLATHLILRSVLKRPLQELTKGIQRISDGDYGGSLDPVPQNDINEIVYAINRMAAQITKRSRQLTESEEKYRSIYENAIEGIYITSVGGRFLDANPAMAATLGYDSPDDLIRSITNISRQLYVCPKIRREYIDRLKKNNLVQGFEVEFYRKDGSRIWVELNARVIHDSNRQLVGIKGFIMDVSHRKRMEITLRQAHDDLELRVNERTCDLEEKTDKLERINSLFIDRELRMKELKAEINDLKIKLSKKENLS